MSYRYKQLTRFFQKDQCKIQWFLFDANGKVLGRLASEIAKILKGKHSPLYTPNADCGDGVIVINARKVKVTGHKDAQKLYRRYSGYPGGLREISYRRMLERHPLRIIELAVRGMMPTRSRLGRSMTKKLRVFVDENHGMEAQKPILVGD